MPIDRKLIHDLGNSIAIAKGMADGAARVIGVVPCDVAKLSEKLEKVRAHLEKIEKNFVLLRDQSREEL